MIKSDEQSFPIFEMSAAMRQEGCNIGFSRIAFRYDPQTFTSAYKKKYVQVQPYSTLKVETKIAQVSSIAKY